MAERRPSPPDPRASLVDSGWSELPAPAKERELPSYDDAAREHLVTRVDDQIQQRIAAMNIDGVDSTEGTVVTAPRKAPPPSLPVPQVPPPPPLPHAALPPMPELLSAPLDEHTVVDSEPAPTSSLPPSRTPTQPPPPPRSGPSRPPPARATASRPSHSRPSHARPSSMPPPPPSSFAPRAAPVAAAPQPVAPLPAAPPPIALPPAAPLPAAQLLAVPITAAHAPVGPLPAVPFPAGPLPSVPPPPAPLHVGGQSAFVPPPSLGEALGERVRVGGAEIPLWGVLAPALGLTAILAALIAGAMAPTPDEHRAMAKAAGADSAAASSSALSSPATGSEAAQPSAAKSGSVVERARAGDEKAIAALDRQNPKERTAEEALALAAGKVAVEMTAMSQLRARLASDPGLAKDPKVIADLRRMAQAPNTSRDALGAMAALPGALSADLLYEAWTSTAERSEVTELAQALLMGKDVRSKASPALAVALDLRETESCEENAKILKRAIDVGDKRAFAPLSRLLRRNGCGPTKRDDCYPCIRADDQLKLALTTVKLRREPEIVRRDTHP